MPDTSNNAWNVVNSSVAPGHGWGWVGWFDGLDGSMGWLDGSMGMRLKVKIHYLNMIYDLGIFLLGGRGSHFPHLSF